MGGNKHNEANGKDISGRNESEGIELRNIQHHRGRHFCIMRKAL